MPKEARILDEFKQFAKKVAGKAMKVPLSDKAYRSRFGKTYSRVSGVGFTKEEINAILQSGNTEQIRELSRYYYRYSGVYSRNIQYYSTLLSYAYLLVPHYDLNASQKKLKAEYKKASQIAKDLKLETNLVKINEIVLSEGVYFGLLREGTDGRPIFYRLPAKYCRTRFYDEQGLPILELDLNYFEDITDNEIERKAILKLFPKTVQAAVNYNKKIRWVEIGVEEGGMCFFFNEDMLPPLVSSSIAIAELQESRDRESSRDEKELNKILIHKLPIDKETGELLFSLPEAHSLHESICNMLEDNDSIDVLTTFGEIKLENVQDTASAASASQSRIDKYVEAAYDELGVSSSLFNADGTAAAMNYSIKKDISIMFAWSKIYENWVNSYIRNRTLKKDGSHFTIRFLSTSSMFRKEDVDLYLKTAQYGYPKTAVAAVLGLDTEDLVQLSYIENEILDLGKFMVPLSSSYTTSGTEKNSNSSEKNNNNSGSKIDLLNEGGRPEKDIGDRADRTNDNRDAKT